jgi:hypothetical protein
VDKNLDKKNLADQFENDLDEFFKERALFRAQAPSDRSKSCSAQQRDDKGVDHFQNMLGCCMTGCHDCPWGYKVG